MLPVILSEQRESKGLFEYKIFTRQSAVEGYFRLFYRHLRVQNGRYRSVLQQGKARTVGLGPRLYIPPNSIHRNRLNENLV
jgi:hypothetical protein